MRCLVSEIYSPPRITEEIIKGKHKYVLPGMAFDITVNDPMDGKPWHFSIKEKRERARQITREVEPTAWLDPRCVNTSAHGRR